MRISSISGLIAVLGALGCSSDAISLGQPPPNLPAIVQITPTAGPVGTEVTVRGSGFAPTGNTVKFGAGYIRNLTSQGGTTLRFTVPDGLDLCAPDTAQPCPGSYPPMTPGDYAVAVTSRGTTSQSITFTVTRQ
jgi:hypothetical protein